MSERIYYGERIPGTPGAGLAPVETVRLGDAYLAWTEDPLPPDDDLTALLRSLLDALGGPDARIIVEGDNNG